MNKKEVAEFLDVGERAVERYVEQGRLSVSYEKGKTRPAPVYNDQEVRALKAELERKLYHKKPLVTRETANPDNGEQTALAPLSALPDFIQMIAATLEQQARMIAAVESKTPQKEEAAVADKLILKLSEASALTGLSRATLREAITARKLKAQIIGHAWRIKRADLEAYVRKL
jgi:excisionase family DNA binding protein